jgi:Cd2+/Zn2+-exporting ATPase
MKDDHANVGKGHGGCEHGHDDSALPQGVLVSASGILTGVGLVLGWMNLCPGCLGMLNTHAPALMAARKKAMKTTTIDHNLYAASQLPGSGISGLR